MQKQQIIKIILGLALAMGLPIGSALVYAEWQYNRGVAVVDRRDAVHALQFVIPVGASKTVPNTDIQALDLPDVVTLTIGVSDTLRIFNADDQPNRAGPFRIAGGSTYRQQFSEPGEFEFVCDVNDAESLTVVVKR